MPGSRLALVADDSALTAAIQAQLLEALGRPAIEWPFTAAGDHLGPDSDGLLVLAAGSAADDAQTFRLVQQITLQQWPVIIVIVYSDIARGDKELVRLEPYVAGCIPWPEGASALIQLVENRLEQAGSFNAADESLIDILNRKLLPQTPSLLPLAEPLAVAATHDVTVLLTGETGTGKTHLARLIHEHS